MRQPVPADLLEIAEALVPDAPLSSARLAEHGNMHHVVLFPGVAAVHISNRRSHVTELPRRVEILRAVAAAGLPFTVPEPLTAVATYGRRDFVDRRRGVTRRHRRPGGVRPALGGTARG
jgi:hypothetical protein